MNINENYDGPYIESMTPKGRDYYGCYHDNDKFYKIRRWLRSHVGECWSDVYSQLVNMSSKPKDRKALELALSWAVDLNCTKEDNMFYDDRGRRLHHEEFAVVDDILYYTGQRIRKQRHKVYVNDQRKMYNVVHIDNNVYAKINNLWYQLMLKSVKMPQRKFYIYPYDVFLNTLIVYSNVNNTLYGSNSYCYAKRQLNKKELRLLKSQLENGVKNEL